MAAKPDISFHNFVTARRRRPRVRQAIVHEKNSAPVREFAFPQGPEFAGARIMLRVFFGCVILAYVAFPVIG